MNLKEPREIDLMIYEQVFCKTRKGNKCLLLHLDVVLCQRDAANTYNFTCHSAAKLFVTKYKSENKSNWHH